MRRFIFPASAILLVAALAYYGIGLLVGAFENFPLVLIPAGLTIGGLAITAYATRRLQD